MKNKGFTLIEILAVIVILALIVTIITPQILNVIQKQKQKSYDIQVKAIENTAKKYVANNSYDLIWEGNRTFIKLSDLIESGLVKAPVKNPKTGILFIYDEAGVLITKTGEKYSYVFHLKTPPPLASAPDIASNMIPIYYDSVDSKWKKADVTNLNNTYKWYDYTNKMWANAVTVTNATRSTYQSAALGTPILETDILTYMVWLPKYKYRIPAGAVRVARTIDIVFEGSTATKSLGDAVATYRTHPAFTFGTTELNGIWMGKYELTGGIGNITIKPGAAALRSSTVASFFTAIRNMENVGNPYGYVAHEVDTHMIKNSEWGAAAYLSHSIYGKNAEVTRNPSSSFITGNPGPEASTTGNVYGIYDMSGSMFEYTMGNLENRSGDSLTCNSGFNGPNRDGSTTTTGTSFPEAKYYNLYTTTNATTACNGGICYGEALSETQGWYDDNDYFMLAASPWFWRGGRYDTGISTGVFSFAYNAGCHFVSSRACQTKQ